MAGKYYTIQSQFPPMKYKNVTTTTWGSVANTCTITDGGIKPNSDIHIWVTGSTPAAGNWALAITAGQVVITSNNSESSTLPLAYVIY